MSNTLWIPAAAVDVWKPFRGNNHNQIMQTVRRAGHVSFKEHLGKPLTDSLWVDLIECLGIKGLRIYRPNEGQWTDGQLGCHAMIYLDDEGLVTDIQYSAGIL